MSKPEAPDPTPFLPGDGISESASDDSQKQPTEAEPELVLEERRHFGPNGNVRRVWTVKVLPDGSEVEHGTWAAFHDNGVLYLDGQYYDGERHGAWTTYHRSGKLRGVGAFDHGKKIGKWTHWDETGQKRREYDCADGEFHGLWTEWDDQDRVVESGVYERGLRQGVWVKRTEDGRMVETRWEGGRSVDPQ